MLSNNEVTEGLLIVVLGANFVLLFFIAWHIATARLYFRQVHRLAIAIVRKMDCDELIDQMLSCSGGTTNNVTKELLVIVGLKTLLLQGLSEPEFYGDLVYKFRKIIGKNDFPYHFKKIVGRYKKINYNIKVMRQTACLVVNPIKVNSFAYLFNCTTVGRTSD